MQNKINKKRTFKKNHNFITSNYRIIYLNVGLFNGSLSQHFFISLAKGYGVFFGI